MHIYYSNSCDKPKNDGKEAVAQRKQHCSERYVTEKGSTTLRCNNPVWFFDRISSNWGNSFEGCKCKLMASPISFGGNQKLTPADSLSQDQKVQGFNDLKDHFM